MDKSGHVIVTWAGAPLDPPGPLGAVAELLAREPITTPPLKRGLLSKRMKGLEPSTFCMASRCSSQLSYIREAGRL